MNEEIQKLDIEILPMREAMDYAQSLESRGDFKYKGIYSIFSNVLEATIKFQHHRILPNLFQLQRELGIPKEKFEEYILELTGRGSIKQKAIVDFPSVDFISGSNRLISMIVFCRPTQQDGASFKRYYDYYKSRTLDALKKWILKKESKWQGDHRGFVLNNLNDAQYSNSHAGAGIHYYLQNPLDKTPEQKMITYKTFTKNILQELINQKLIFYTKGEGNFFTIQFPDEESYLDRFGMLVSKLGLVDQTFIFAGEINLKNLDEYKNKIETLKPNQYISLYWELKIILNELIRFYRQKEEQEKKERLQKIIEELSKFESVVPATMLRNLKEEDMQNLISQADVLYTEFFYGGKIVDFFLYKKNIFPALLHARKQFLEKHDDTEFKILLQMDIERFLQGEQLKIYQSTEEEILFSKLPFLLRIFRLLFGKTGLKKEEKEKIKELIRKEEIEKQIRYKKKEASQKTKELAKKKIELETVENKPQVNIYEEEVKKLKNSIQKDEKAEELLLKVIQVLDEAWDKRELPNRLTLLEQIPDFQNNEDYLIQFLKKYGKGKIYSFRITPHDPNSPKININDPIYVWPILISKNYISKNGFKLLKKAMEEVDAQKNALMPEQKKFDISTAIEDFLNRVLSKKNQ